MGVSGGILLQGCCSQSWGLCPGWPRWLCPSPGLCPAGTALPLPFPSQMLVLVVLVLCLVPVEPLTAFPPKCECCPQGTGEALEGRPPDGGAAETAEEPEGVGGIPNPHPSDTRWDSSAGRLEDGREGDVGWIWGEGVGGRLWSAGAG